MLDRLVATALVAAAALVASGPQSQAFWKRSLWDACNDAPTEADRIRLQCWIFYPVGEFPPGVIGVEGWYGGPPYGGYRPKPRNGGPVVKRLG